MKNNFTDFIKSQRWPFWVSLSLALTAALLLVSVLLVSYGTLIPVLAAMGVYLISHLGLTGSIIFCSGLLAVGITGAIAESQSPGSVSRFFKALVDILTVRLFHDKLYSTSTHIDLGDSTLELNHNVEKVTSSLEKAGATVNKKIKGVFTKGERTVKSTEASAGKKMTQ